MAIFATFPVNPYTELGLDPATTDAEIRKAYFSLVRIHSPEKDPEQFKRIRSAYERLSTPEKRFETDMLCIQPWMPPELPPMEKENTSAWTDGVLRAARAFSDLDRKHFREDFREVKV